MNSKIRGFTLIEILTVIAIIAILIALLSPAIRGAREQAKIDKTRAMIASLEVAINMYYTDQGSYPSVNTWGNLLTQRANNYGPYMDTKDFENGNFKDPWDRDYHYAEPGANNVNTFDLYSDGPRIDTDSDNIENW